MISHILTISISKIDVQLILAEVKVGESKKILSNYISSNEPELKISLEDLIRVLENSYTVIHKTAIEEVEIDLERICSDILVSAIEEYQENYTGDKQELNEKISLWSSKNGNLEDDLEEHFEEE